MSQNKVGRRRVERYHHCPPLSAEPRRRELAAPVWRQAFACSGKRGFFPPVPPLFPLSPNVGKIGCGVSGSTRSWRAKCGFDPRRPIPQLSLFNKVSIGAVAEKPGSWLQTNLRRCESFRRLHALFVQLAGWLTSTQRMPVQIRQSVPISSRRDALMGRVAQFGRAADLYPVAPDKRQVAGSSPATPTKSRGIQHGTEVETVKVPSPVGNRLDR